MKDTNLDNTDLTGAKLPQNKLLVDTYNLDKVVGKEAFTAIIPQQKDKVIEKAVEQIAEVSVKSGATMSPEQKTTLNTTIKELIREGGAVGEYIKKGLEATPEDTLNKKFPIDPKSITNVADYKDKTNNLMTVLFENKTGDIAAIRNAISANIIADEVTTNLFKEGASRGQDGLTIKQITQQAVTKFAQENPEIKAGLATALDNPEQKPQLINGITETIRDPNNKIIEKTWAGTVRLDSDRIQLKTNISAEDAANRIKTQINDAHGIIAGPDLKRMIAEGKEISLENKKLVGDFSDIDLSGKSLKGADLTKVTSIGNVNLEKTNLTDVKFPENKQLFTETYNLNKAVITDKGAFADIIKQQNDKMIEKAVNAIAEVAAEKSGTTMSPEQKTTLGTNIKELIAERGQVSKYIKESLTITPKDITDKNFPTDPAKITHVADYEGKTSNIMTVLLENRTNSLEATRNAVAADVMADTITQGLFKEGTGRGQDGLTIKQLTQQAATKFTQDNPGVDLNKFLGTPEGDKLLAGITEVIKNNAIEKTMVGALTRNDERIQLKTNIPSEAIVNKITTEMNVACGTIKLNENELTKIQTMAQKVGIKLFGENYTNNEGRKSDVALMKQQLKDTFYQIKVDNKGVDISSMVDQHMDKIVGTKLDRGNFYDTPGTGLAGIYSARDVAPYTAAGKVTGGIQLDHAVVATLGTSIKAAITDVLQPSLIAAQQVQEEIKNTPSQRQDTTIVSQDIATAGVATTTRQEQPIGPAPDPYPLNKKEHEGIETVANTISTNLFGAAAIEEGGARFSDAKIIENTLKNVIHQIKVENEGKDISKVMTPKNAQQIIATLAKELVPEFREGTKEIRDHKNRGTGDIGLDTNQVATGDFKAKLQEKVRTLVDPILTVAKNLEVVQKTVESIANPKIEGRTSVASKDLKQTQGAGRS